MVCIPHMRHTILSAIKHGQLAALICAVHRHITSLVSSDQEVLCSMKVDRINCSMIVLHSSWCKMGPGILYRHIISSTS
jgi:hypothetical protein